MLPVLIPFLKLVAALFFEKKYFQGRYFDGNDFENSIKGWRWVFRSIIWQKIFGFNRFIPWPASPFIVLSNPNNISFDIEDLHIFQPYGIYFQNFKGDIVIGKGTYIAPNVGIITSNHNPHDLDTHLEGKDVIIGKKCWIGMNSVILPGVELGDCTIVGAGSIVTKSFTKGNIVIAGNPAREIKEV